LQEIKTLERTMTNVINHYIKQEAQLLLGWPTVLPQS